MRAEGVLPAFPQQIALAVVARDAHFARMMQAANLGDLRGLRFDGFGQAFDFDQQHRRAILGKSGVHVILDRAQRQSIEHFASGRRDRRAR